MYVFRSCARARPSSDPLKLNQTASPLQMRLGDRGRGRSARTNERTQEPHIRPPSLARIFVHILHLLNSKNKPERVTLATSPVLSLQKPTRFVFERTAWTCGRTLRHWGRRIALHTRARAPTHEFGADISRQIFIVSARALLRTGEFIRRSTCQQTMGRLTREI